MSGTDPQLLKRTLELVNTHDVGGATPAEIVEWTLETLAIEEQWQSLAYDDVSCGYEDEHSQTFDSVDKLLEALGTMAMSPRRALYHRFVLRTDWQQVRARLDWRPA